MNETIQRKVLRTWEYMRTTGGYHGGCSTEEILGSYGKQGWELVSAITEGGQAVFYLKREVLP